MAPWKGRPRTPAVAADALAHAAHRRAEPLGLAARYEARGQCEVAAEVRAETPGGLVLGIVAAR